MEIAVEGKRSFKYVYVYCTQEAAVTPVGAYSHRCQSNTTSSAEGCVT